MKGKLLISSLILGTALMALAATDPVLMTINGKDVKLSEFEYLYNKNNQQQIEKESLEDYVDRFVIYKLKVADAEAAGYDTLPAFKKEFEGYRDDFVKPFLEDTTAKNSLVD
jgi:peptidyl-prolyl cis-trans isomerase SurA